MSQTAITIAFEQWKAQQGAENVDVVLDEFVFANVPGLDPEKPVDRLETIPVASVVHRQAVSKTGVVNENAVVYSVVLGAEVGDFDFNWIGLANKASGTLAMVVHAPVQKKVATAAGQQGNVLTRSFLMEYSGAATETQINTPAETWQIDFTARLAAMDERQRVENTDIFGAGAFFGDGWLVVRNGNQYSAQSGAGYVGGLRAELAATQPITVGVKPVKIWLDVCWKGTLTSVWGVEHKLVSAETLQNYQSEGVQHYVFALASIDASGVVTDLRPKGTLGDQQGNNDFVRKDKNLSDLNDAGKARKNIGLGDIATRDAKEFVPVLRKVNNKALSQDIELNAKDVGALTQDIGDARYVKLDGDTMTGGLVTTDITAGTLRATNGIVAINAVYQNNNQYSRLYFSDAGGENALAYLEADFGKNLVFNINGRRFIMDKDGKMFAPAGVYDSGQRVYSQANPPPAIDLSWVAGSKWVVDNYAPFYWVMENFAPKSTAGLAQTGWHRDASTGLITQWGFTNNASGLQTVYFPIAFPNSCFSIQSTPYTSGVIGTVTSVVMGFNNSSATFNASQSIPVFWEAKGY